MLKHHPVGVGVKKKEMPDQILEEDTRLKISNGMIVNKYRNWKQHMAIDVGPRNLNHSRMTTPTTSFS
ncbi:hypothetical protein TNCV_3732921 [Trichonephila clavipes]|nr:hypothetical protein TNCV_3732921 [Trichonephila clavipes]